jgi:hypothetical protein
MGHYVNYIGYFNVRGSVHCNDIPTYISNKMQRYAVYFIWKLLYMFRVVPSPVIRSANPKHVEQFPDKINCVTLHLLGYIYIYIYIRISEYTGYITLKDGKENSH